MLRAAALLFSCMLAAGCMHISGMVEESPGHPSNTAVLAVGRPGGIGVSTPHKVDSKGRFDFWMSSLDENDVYVYDSLGDPVMTLRRVDRRDLGSNMKLFVPSGASRTGVFPDTP